MKVLIIGCYGQLGRCLFDEFNIFNEKIEAGGCPTIDIVGIDKDTLDITDENAVKAYFERNQFDYCVNCAAYTNVNKAEEDKETAFKLNADAVKFLAEACRIHNIKFIHISTDYVFGNNRNGTTPESAVKIKNEFSEVDPLNVYGASKLAGEYDVLSQISLGLQAIIIRTAWLYSIYGNNFVKTILNKAKTEFKLSVVYDQIGTPTSAADLAYAILMIIAEDQVNENTSGIYHFSNEGVCSWYDFAKTIVEYAGYNTYIIPVKTDLKTIGANRPMFSVLGKEKIKSTFNTIVPYWRDSLKKTIEELLKTDK